MKAKNHKYYETHKDMWKSKYQNQKTTGEFGNRSVVYAVHLPDGKKYVGVSGNFSIRSQQHKQKHGDVYVEPVLVFNRVLDTTTLNGFENLIITRHFGAENCVNQNNSKPGNIMNTTEYLACLSDEHRALVEGCFGQN